MTPEAAMRLALSQGRRVQGRTFPNPAVGAVLYRGDRVLGRGATRPPGGLHAEAVAIAQARRRHGAAALRAATLAVTLEPCDHTGRTGPCTAAIVEAGIRRVQIGCRDPHALVAGRGLRRLRRAGLRVEVGILEEACRHHHRGFLSLCERGRPFVSLKLATSLDARIATGGGESRWITSPESRKRVHALRAHVDAVMVGSETARVDDPELTARRGGSVVHRPVRVLVDGRLRVPVRARLFRSARETPTWVLCRAQARGRRAREALGARLLPVATRGDHLDLACGLARLGAEGLTHVWVEGGGGLAAALLRARLVDEIHWFLAPTLIGADGRPAIGVLGAERLADAIPLEGWQLQRVGPDLHVTARVSGSRGRRPRGR